MNYTNTTSYIMSLVESEVPKSQVPGSKIDY